MKRVYHPYWDWEDYKDGMWRVLPKDEESAMVERAVIFTGDAVLYGSFMVRVTREWPIACEQNLTNEAMNRRAWVGHAAASMAIKSPEYITRVAWWMLTEQQRVDADAQADRAIADWLFRYQRKRFENIGQYDLPFVAENQVVHC